MQMRALENHEEEAGSSSLTFTPSLFLFSIIPHI